MQISIITGGKSSSLLASSVLKVLIYSISCQGPVYFYLVNYIYTIPRLVSQEPACFYLECYIHTIPCLVSQEPACFYSEYYIYTIPCLVSQEPACFLFGVLYIHNTMWLLPSNIVNVLISFCKTKPTQFCFFLDNLFHKFANGYKCHILIRIAQRLFWLSVECLRVLIH